MKEKRFKEIVSEGIADLFYIWWQELKAVVKDQGVLIFFILVPLGYPLLYTFIYTNETVREVPAVVVDNNRSTLSREYLRLVDAGPDLHIVSHCADMEEAKALLKEGKAYGIIYIPESFSRDIAKGIQTRVTLYCDMSGMLYYKAMLTANTNASLTMNKQIKIERSGNTTERVVSDVTIKVTKQDGKVVRKQISGQLTDVTAYPQSEAFLKAFQPAYQATLDFVSRKIGSINETITSKDAFFGPSAFIDLIHQLQLDLTGADVSFCAPLSMYAEIKKGDIYVSDMFNLYKFENMLYTMELTGKEIKNFLEMSYALWTNQMKSPDDRLLLFSDDPENKYIFKNFSFNFDSAAGIIYTVDVTRPEGEKITIQSMADGSPFQPEKVYKVAVNSYRGNGGGNLLTKGAGIPKEDLAKRIIFATDKDLRFYLMKRIEEVKVLDPKPLNQWKMIPEEWTVPAARRDYDFLFNRNK